jgi:hypothetical protein
MLISFQKQIKKVSHYYSIKEMPLMYTTLLAQVGNTGKFDF